MPRRRWLGATAKSLIPPGACSCSSGAAPTAIPTSRPPSSTRARQGRVEPRIVEEQMADPGGGQVVVYQGLAQQVARPRQVVRGENAVAAGDGHPDHRPTPGLRPSRRVTSITNSVRALDPEGPRVARSHRHL